MLPELHSWSSEISDFVSTVGENTQARLSTVISPSRRLWQWVARQSSGREMEPQAPVVHLGQSYYSDYRPPIASPGQAIALSYWSRYVTGSLYI